MRRLNCQECCGTAQFHFLGPGVFHAHNFHQSSASHSTAPRGKRVDSVHFKTKLKKKHSTINNSGILATSIWEEGSCSEWWMPPAFIIFGSVFFFLWVQPFSEITRKTCRIFEYFFALPPLIKCEILCRSLLHFLQVEVDLSRAVQNEFWRWSVSTFQTRGDNRTWQSKPGNQMATLVSMTKAELWSKRSPERK